MAKILILDTETTGFDGQAIEIAYTEILYPTLMPIKTVDLFFKPTIPINFGAMATHHILESELEDKPIVGEKLYQEQINYIDSFDYVVGHNCDFDCRVLNITKPKRIDTLALSRYLLPDIDSHSQSALMYYFFEDKAWVREKIRNAHNAACDVGNCLLVLSKLLNLIEDKHAYPEEEYTPVADIEGLYKFSEFARIPTKMHFGKHKDKTYLEVAKTDPGYFDWWRNKSDTKPDEYQMKAIIKAMEDRRK